MACSALIGFVWSGPLFFTPWTSEPCLQKPFFVYPSIARASVSARIPLMNALKAEDVKRRLNEAETFIKEHQK